MKPRFSQQYLAGLFEPGKYQNLAEITALLCGSDAYDPTAVDFGLGSKLFLLVEGLNWFASTSRSGSVTYFESARHDRQTLMLAELSACDWVLVEGFKAAALPKIEVWRAANGKPVQYPSDPRIVAVATDQPASLPEPTALPVLALSDVAAVAEFLWSDAERYEYVATAAKAAAEAADAHAGRGAGASGRRGPPAGR